MAVFWASSYPLGRHLAQFEVPAVVAGLRLLFATSFLLLFAGARGQLRITLTARQVAQFALLGFAGFCVHGLLLMYALQFTHANTGAVINGAIPVVVVVLDFVLFRRRIAARGLIGVALAFLGTAVVVTHGALGSVLLAGIGRGEALFLVAITGWAVYSIAGRPLLAVLPPLAVTTYACVAGLILLAPLALAQAAAAAPLLNNPQLVLAIGAQAFFSMSLGFTWYSQGVQQIGALNTAMYANVVPVAAFVLSAVTLGELPDGPLVLGALLVMGGLVVVNRAQARTAI